MTVLYFVNIVHISKWLLIIDSHLLCVMLKERRNHNYDSQKQIRSEFV